jgi:predicted regulator of Ras-like GTPase activity (Roadblock/LC7/MglB family)
MLKPVLSKFLSLEGVLAACVVENNGTVLERVGQGARDSEDLGQLIHQGMLTSQAMAAELGGDALTMIFVELEQGTLLAAALDNDHILAIISKNNTNIGRIRYELKKNRDTITAAL